MSDPAHDPRPPVPVKIISCDHSYSEQILAIFNDAIANTTAIYDYKPRTPAMMEAWFDSKAKGNFPVLGAVAEDGALMGFASYGPFRPFPAYKYSVEHSLYVAAGFRGQGLGKRLLQEIIAAARAQSYHVMIGCIDSQNAASIALHRSFGFQHAGTIRHAGFKFGNWLDAEFHQLILDTPEHPIDG